LPFTVPGLTSNPILPSIQSVVNVPVPEAKRLKRVSDNKCHLAPSFVASFHTPSWLRGLLFICTINRETINEYGAAGGMSIGRGNGSTKRTCSGATLTIINLIWPGIEQGPPRWEADN
jgi:hypothetical protein